MGQHALDTGTRVGEYLIESLIARGGMGAVYEATHPVIGKKAAVKVMRRSVSDEGGLERFIQEARAVNQIRHPNIVDVFSFGRLDDGRAYMVMELVEGEVLADALRAGPLPVSDAVGILNQLASAVAAAHHKGVVHRDLKPDNIMLVTHADGRRQVKLLDFGIAKLANPEGHAVMGKTQTGLVLGTPYYMSPAQARGKGVDHRTDIYALGCITYEMLTGSVPYPSDNPTDAVIQHCQAPIPSTGAERAEVPHGLDDLVRRMLAKSSDLRPTLTEVREELAAISATLPGSAFAGTFGRLDKDPTPIPTLVTPYPSASPVPAARTVSESARSSRGLMWIGLVAVLALSAGGVVLLMGGRGDSGEGQAAAAASADSEGERNSATLIVEVDVEEAAVYLDGELKGTAKPKLQIPTIKPGKHRLEVRAEGRVTQVQRVTVRASETVRSLITMPAATAETAAAAADAGNGEDGDGPPTEAKPASGSSSSSSSRPSRRHSGSSRRNSNRVRKASKRDRDYTIDPFAK